MKKTRRVEREGRRRREREGGRGWDDMGLWVGMWQAQGGIVMLVGLVLCQGLQLEDHYLPSPVDPAPTSSTLGLAVRLCWLLNLLSLLH
jgi:hypothetical protein